MIVLILVLILISLFLRSCINLLSKESSTQTEQMSVWGTKAELRRRLVDRKLVEAPPPVILLLAVPIGFLCFVSLGILDVACRYLSLFLLFRYRNR